MLHQTFLFLGQLWLLFEVSQILEFLRYKVPVIIVGVPILRIFMVIRAQGKVEFQDTPGPPDTVALRECSKTFRYLSTAAESAG